MYSKKYYGLLRAAHSRNPKNTSNLAFFLKENRFFSVFFGGPKIKTPFHASMNSVFSLFLSIFSYHLMVASEIYEAVAYFAEFVHELQELRVFCGYFYIEIEHEFKFFVR